MNRTLQQVRADHKRFQVDCYIHGFQDFYHLSHIHAGLLELRDTGRIQLSFSFSKPLQTPSEDPLWTPWLRVIDRSTGRVRNIVLDLDDRSHVLYDHVLPHCDVYYKRNPYGPELSHLPTTYRAKIKPFGLHYHCRYRRQNLAVLCRAIPSLFVATALHYRSDARKFTNRLRKMREFTRMLPIRLYEQSPDISVDPVIFFQPRISTKPNYSRENFLEPRVALVRALKKEFGKRFLGGLASSEGTKRDYADLLSPYSTHPMEYIARGKRALIGIASLACVMTSSMKIAEYLAASRCIVSPPMRNDLPSPLLDGVNFLGYNTVDECVENCARLFDDPAFAQQMRRKNWEYYQAEVAPAQHMMNLLDRAFNKSH